MSLLDKIERRFRRFALPHLTIGLILCQVVVYAMSQGQMLKAGGGDPQGQTVLDRIALVPDKVLEGQVWRLLTFVCEPPVTNVVFALFFWYLFYLMGEALELNWGPFRYNVYLLIGYLATVAVSFLTPQAPASIGFLEGSVFLAFAALFPDFVIHLFFLLPVKIKWLALLAWIGYFFALVFGDLDDTLAGAGVDLQFPAVLQQGHPLPLANGPAEHGAAGEPYRRQAETLLPPLHGLRHYRSQSSPGGIPLLPPVRWRSRVTAWSTCTTTSISRRGR